MAKDFTHEKVCPIVICFVKYKDKFLILKRSDKVLAYKNMWGSIAGFLDDKLSPKEKAIEEVTSELNIDASDIKEVIESRTYSYLDKSIDRVWIKYIFLAKIATDKIEPNWEHVEHAWISPKEIDNYETVPNTKEDLELIKNL